MVTEDELSTLLHMHGWYLDMQKVYQTRYAYAKRRVGKKVQTKYLVTERKLSQLSAEDILKKIGI
jgi:hypothetical protein